MENSPRLTLRFILSSREDNVIIYADSIILGNVRIGENSVVGAKTLVNIDVPPNSLVIGNPCKIIVKN